ncbi:MAG: hypothetical protein V4527_18255 [Pseudomonadota bacterium]
MPEHKALTRSLTAMRSYRIEQRRDFVSGFDHQLRISGPSVGGYGDLHDSYGGKFPTEAGARLAGELFVELGILPAFQTAERIAIYREAAALRRAA